jgi:hypothetical protein
LKRQEHEEEVKERRDGREEISIVKGGVADISLYSLPVALMFQVSSSWISVPRWLFLGRCWSYVREIHFRKKKNTF